MRKKVLFVLPYWKRGGAEKQFRYIYDGIIKYHNVDILLLNYDEICKENSENVFYVKNSLFRENSKIIKFVLRIVSYIKINVYIKNKLSNYDVCIAHNKLLIPIMPMLKRKCKKVIFSAREADEAFSKGLLAKILSEMDMLTCNSRVTYDLLKDINDKTLLINNGVELVENKSTYKINKIKNVGIIANVTRRKNIKLVIESLRYTNHEFKLLIAGKVVDSEYYEEIISYIQEYNLEHRVDFRNYISDMDEFYNSCDLIILPSLYEGTSNVILESFSRKKLIMMSNIKENIYLVNAKYADLVMFNPHNSEQLAQKLNYLNELILKNENVLDEIIETNYEMIKLNYSINGLQEEYLKILES